MMTTAIYRQRQLVVEPLYIWSRESLIVEHKLGRLAEVALLVPEPACDLRLGCNGDAGRNLGRPKLVLQPVGWRLKKSFETRTVNELNSSLIRCKKKNAKIQNA